MPFKSKKDSIVRDLPHPHESKYFFIFSNHFDETAYERDLRNELLGLPLRRRLKADALPTLCLSEDNINKEYEKKNNEDTAEAPSKDKVLSIELQRQRDNEALKRAENAELRKEQVERIIMKEVGSRNVTPTEMGIIIESERNEDGTVINHKAVLKPKVFIIISSNTLLQL